MRSVSKGIHPRSFPPTQLREGAQATLRQAAVQAELVEEVEAAATAAASEHDDEGDEEARLWPLYKPPSWAGGMDSPSTTVIYHGAKLPSVQV